MTSYKAKVIAADNHLLLGSTKTHESSRFELFEQAWTWLVQCVNTNVEAGRQPAGVEITTSFLEPEIRTDI